MVRSPHNNSRRRRGRRPNGKGNGSVDSSGPSVKVRGSAKQVYDKYLILARDAKSSGDSILSESYFQHAEHYARVLIENGKFEVYFGDGVNAITPGQAAVFYEGNDIIGGGWIRSSFNLNKNKITKKLIRND